MKHQRRLGRTAILATAVALIAAGCNSGGTATDAPELIPATGAPPTTTAPTAPPEAPTTTELAKEPPPAVAAPAAMPEPSIDFVAISIDEIGVSAVVPADWKKRSQGFYAGPDGLLEFGAELVDDAPDPAAHGFVPAGQRVAGDLTWDLFAMEEGDVFVGVALTRVGDVQYSVALQTQPDLADEYLESVAMPVLEAFDVVEPVEQVATLVGTPPQDVELGAVLDELVADTDLPAVGVTVFDSDEILESAVAGVRRDGDPTRVELDDQFSIGSNVKAMTATLVGTFVDEGALTWDTTVAEVFGDALGELDPTMADVTIRHLLAHTAGLNDEVAGFGPTILGTSGDDRPLVEQRADIARQVFTTPGQHPVGEHMYSNIGYTTIGAVLEHVTGEPYEDLLQRRVFDVLDMDSCGFYAPGTPGHVDQPWGHFDQQEGEPVEPGGPDAELGHAIAPAGTVHCSMADWVRFLQSQLRGFQGSENEIVGPETFAALQTPAPETHYALGWGVIPQDTGGTLVWHNGSNGRFTSEAWLIPSEDRAMLMVTNLGVGLAFGPMEQVADAIFARYSAEATS